MEVTVQPRVAVDIGGTFTDIVLIDAGGRIWTTKIPSTPDDYGRAILEGVHALLREAGVAPGDVGGVVHATTIATNAILERKGPRVGLLTTTGFRDVLEIARIRTPTLFDLSWEKPAPLVPRRLRAEVDERMRADGAVIRSVDLGSARTAIASLIEGGATSIAVCFLNSYANPAHEQETAALIRREYPDRSVSISSDVLPEIKEYERTSTTVINAFLEPVIRDYLGALRSRLTGQGIAAPIQVMRSNGGTMSAEAAARRPIHIVGSGPAAGVIAAQQLATRIGEPSAVAFDMGGTTAKASVIEDGRFSRTAEYEVRAGITTPSRFIKAGGYLMMVPAIDLAEVGNGAGSIARVDRGGALRVGPESAGAAPGPACYDLGGTEPTITDANLLLGFLNPDGLAGGSVPVNADRARAAVDRGVAGPLGMSTVEAAWGIHTVANSNMLRATRAVTTERGRDPRRFVLCAFGGSGPVHAAEIALALGVSRVIVPNLAGLFSAVGLLYSDVEHSYSRTRLQMMAEVSLDGLRAGFADLEGQAHAAMLGEGFGSDEVELERQADLRYLGQAPTLTVDLALEGDDASLRANLVEAFGSEHERTYGHRSEEEPVQLVNLRLIARVRTGSRLGWSATAGHAVAASLARRGYFGPRYGWREVTIARRADLSAVPVPGPMIIEDYDSTTVVPPFAAVAVTADNDLILDLSAPGGQT